MDKYEEEVSALAQTINSQTSQRTVFYGSSSIRMWASLASDFPYTKTLNLGFGGSTLAACAWYFERLIVPANPRLVIFYAGDNDLGEDRQPEEVYLFFCVLVQKMQRFFPQVPLVFLSIKPSPARWSIIDRIRRTNDLIYKEISHLPNFHYVDLAPAMLTSEGEPRQELYEADGLHLNPAGYALWKQELQRQMPVLDGLQNH